MADAQNCANFQLRSPHWTNEEFELLILCYISSLALIKMCGPVPTIHHISEAIKNKSNKLRVHKAIFRCIQRNIYSDKMKIGNFCEHAVQELTSEMVLF